MAVDLAPFGRCTLRDEAVQRRSPLRWASPAQTGTWHAVKAEA